MSSSTELDCGGSIEWLNASQMVTKQVKVKTMNLQMIRNEFREIYVTIKSQNKVNLKLPLVDVNIHKNFVVEGKASIHFTKDNIRVMISNAPPSMLVMFLKTMFVKLTSRKNSPKINTREQLLSKKPQSFEEISPISSKDVNRLNSQIAKLPPAELKKRHILQQRKKQDTTRKCAKSLDLANTKLTEEQKEVLQAAVSGQNIFFTGSAGTGKSFLLRCLLSALPPDFTAATASTGAAACLIGGITLHSFAGIGSGEGTFERCLELAKRPQVAQNWRKFKYLVIDEISMVEKDYFEKIEKIARIIRNNNDEPFGGLKLIFCGDFLQLPPVVTGKSSSKKFCFQSEAWARCNLRSFILQTVHRQADPKFVSLLNNIRMGRVTDDIVQTLKLTAKNELEKDGIIPTQLCCRTNEAETINNNKLAQLTGTEKRYDSVDSVSDSKTLNDQTPVSRVLVLKEGAQVMLLKNINVGSGLVNGARGFVLKFSPEGAPVIKFKSGLVHTLQPEKWVVKCPNGTLLTRRQYPLKLAWAFSIHKSQISVCLHPQNWTVEAA
ncbi:ATP-dependent DNA helicase PIF1 [Diaphorina citri]|uniref:ATP-dependent DNA helicase n=1 Tax=Diaphorina citri TaxID=121845 RepID=A0A3Q0JCT3_DIACI|nr:ATP-dependent DNA helicase PIF1 [Diaphorina citri]